MTQPTKPRSLPTSLKKTTSSRAYKMMRASFLGLATSLLVLLHPQSVVASPSVNVALRASFDAAPYLVELLYVCLKQPFRGTAQLTYSSMQRNSRPRKCYSILPPPRPHRLRLLRRCNQRQRPLRIFSSGPYTRQPSRKQGKPRLIQIRTRNPFRRPANSGALSIL